METVEPKALRNVLKLRHGDDDSNQENVEKASPYVHLHTPLSLAAGFINPYVQFNAYNVEIQTIYYNLYICQIAPKIPNS